MPQDMAASALLYTREQAAALTQVSLPTIDKWIRYDELPIIRVGRYYRIPADKFKAWLDQKTSTYEGET